MVDTLERAAAFWLFIGITFVLLKVAGHIDWPWLMVTAPLWVPACIAAVVAGLWVLRK